VSWGQKKISGLGALAVSVAMCCALAAWKWDFLMMAKDVVSNRMAKRCTVEERVEQYGTVVRERLSPFFEKADVPWPARRLVLVGLKEERQLEVWGEDATGTLKLIRVYPVLGASGTIGPKLIEGDGQVPEGIYDIESLNPNSAFHLSLRVSYPNAFDRERAEEDGRQRPGSDIMIHGGTASAGCLAMGNEAAEDLFVMAALAGTANVEVILCPCDLRVKRPRPPANAPAWTALLYQILEAKMKTLPRP
jgi:hypothetical protein